MLGVYANPFGFKRTVQFVLLMEVALFAAMIGWFPTSFKWVFITSFLSNVLGQWDFLLSVQLSAYFPDIGASGMVYTMNTSATNLGKNVSMHTLIISYTGWRLAATLGLVIQFLVIVFWIGPMMDSIDKA